MTPIGLSAAIAVGHVQANDVGRSLACQKTSGWRQMQLFQMKEVDFQPYL